MKCDQAIELIQATLDSGGPIRLTQAADRHLAECASCRSAFANLMQLHNSLGEHGSSAGDAVPGGFHERLMSRISAEPVHSHDEAAENSIWWWAGVAAMIIAVAGWYFASGISREQSKQVAGNNMMVKPTLTPTIDESSTEIKVATDDVITQLREIDLHDAIPTPAVVYASVGAEVRDFSESFYQATTSLADSLTPADATPGRAAN